MATTFNHDNNLIWKINNTADVECRNTQMYLFPQKYSFMHWDSSINKMGGVCWQMGLNSWQNSNFSLCHHAQTGIGTNLVCGTWGYFPKSEVARVCS
jgi:hypothetical protein